MEGEVKSGEKGLVRRSNEEEAGETGLDGACRFGFRSLYVRGLVEDWRWFSQVECGRIEGDTCL